MSTLTKNALSVTVRDRAKLTKIWDHKGYKSVIKIFSKIQNFIKKKQFGHLDQKCNLGNGEK